MKVGASLIVEFPFLLDGDRGMITAEQVAGAINDPEFYHNPLTSLVLC
jgi:hypothetical protein